MAFSDDTRPAGAAATQGVEGDALALLTQLFNARQRRLYAESELDNAKENLKTAKRVEEEIMLAISGAVPRLHAVAKEKNMLHKGLETMPPLLDWKREAQVKEEVRNGSTQGDPGDENDHDPAKPYEEDGKVVFGARFHAKYLGVEDNVMEHEISCRDCSRVLARVKTNANDVPEDDDAMIDYLVEQFRKNCSDIHDELYHNGKGPSLP